MPVSTAPTNATPVSATPVSATPTSAALTGAAPVSGTPASATPTSAAPVSGTPAPPWGMVAPPWSSVAPSQPVGAEPGSDLTPTVDDEDGGTTGQDRSPTGWDPAVGANGNDIDQHRNVEGRGGSATGADHHPGGDVPDEGRALPVYDGLLDFPGPARPEPAAYPEQGAWPAVPQTFHQSAAYPVAEEPERRGRNRTMVAVVVGGAAVALVAVVAGGAVWLGRDAPPPAPAPSVAKPKVTGPPPVDLRLRDDTTTITVTWTDPTDGGVPFVVAGGRAGQKLGVMATVDAGQTRYTVNGLSAKLDYCFTVLAVYSTDSYATSGQVCTDREGGGTPN
ncbi:hypothetical protein [Micromonospora sp. WMMD975]|uniref:hypothetical protein n=1 Tax=Micromonospora sp. WMMD975 TaxID=3016087 RepID=UPI00249A9BBE|nr:hypothetical protein [Micromonospora sp. WMMD975]WFE36890.1 hypothetical protein O7613_15220 [Micromonospora sp. WMMD975]